VDVEIQSSCTQTKSFYLMFKRFKRKRLDLRQFCVVDAGLSIIDRWISLDSVAQLKHRLDASPF